MKALFTPSSIAVIGGSNDLGKPGGRVLHNLKLHGFPTLWVVNPKGDPIQALPTFGSVEALPAAPELAILSVAAPHVLDATRKLLDRGTRALIVLSAGFSETDEAGKALEAELVAMVQAAGGHMVGPNCMGIVTPAHFGVFGGPQFEPAPGTIDILSASGSTAAFIMELGLDRGLRFASMASVGNCGQLGVEELLAFQDEAFAEQPARAKLLYLEAIEDPAGLLRHARSLAAKGCRLVGLKSGTTDVGSRAASSHTGAMATPDAAVGALFDKAGIVRVHSRSEATDCLALLGNLRPPQGDNVVIVTHAGGPGILLADELSRQGYQVPELPLALQERLKAVMFPGSSARNPVDFLAAGTPEHLRAILRLLGEQTELPIGAVCVVFGSPGLTDVWPAFQEIIAGIETAPFPVYPILPSVRVAAEPAAKFCAQGHYLFTDEVSLAVALGRIRQTPAPAAAPELVPMDRDRIAAVLDEAARAGTRQLDPTQVETILRAAGFTLPAQEVVHGAEAAVAFAESLGFPVVMKVVGPVHKSDVQGVLVGVPDAAAVRQGFARLMDVPGATAVLVQQMASGVEMILGASREGAFGHLVLFGLGGIFTETLHDVQMGLAPLSRPEAARMIGAIRGAAMLRGVRGKPGVDLDAVADCVLRISTLVTAFPQIAEMDLNPLMGRGAALLAVDGRIAVGPPAAAH